MNDDRVMSTTLYQIETLDDLASALRSIDKTADLSGISFSNGPFTIESIHTQSEDKQGRLNVCIISNSGVRL